MPHPVCMPFSGSINPNNLTLGGNYVITDALTAGVSYNYVHGFVLDEVQCLVFDSEGLSIPAIKCVKDPANGQTNFIITPDIDYPASELTVKIMGRLPLSITNADITLGGIYHIMDALTAGVSYTYTHGFTVSNANFLPFDSEGLSIPAIKIVADPAALTTKFIITPSTDYAASEIYVRVLGNV